jgi:hypothetical protein
MSPSRLGTDSCRNVGLGWTPLVVGDPVWGQTLDSEHGIPLGTDPKVGDLAKDLRQPPRLGTDPGRPLVGGFRMSTSGLGTDFCRSVGLGWTPLVVGDPGWGQTLDSVNGNTLPLVTLGTDPVVECWRGTKCLGKRPSKEPSRRVR